MTKPTINILVVGEAKAGKTTLINAFCNLISHDSYQEVINQRYPTIVFDGKSIYYGDSQSEPDTIPYKSNVNKTDEVDWSEVSKDLQSHTLKLDGYNVRVIKTCDILDIDKVGKRRASIDGALKEISVIGTLDIILFVINKPQSTSFGYALRELLEHLHEDSHKNIMFAFTNTINSNYLPGDNLDVVKEELEKLKDKYKVSIPITKQNVFCFDNLWFHEAIADAELIQTGGGYDLEKCFDRNKKELMRLFTKGQALQSHVIEKTVCMNDVRKLLLNLYRPVDVVAARVLKSGQDVDKKVEQAFRSSCVGSNNIITTIEETNHSVVVCTTCAEFLLIGGLKRPKYKVCENPCSINNIQSETIPIEAIKRCNNFNNSSCLECGCSWDRHMVVNYVLKEQKIENFPTKSTKRMMFLEKMNKQKEDEIDLIRNYSVDFALYIQQHIQTSQNDILMDYLNLLSSLNESGNTLYKNLLEQTSKEYKYENELLKYLTAPGRSCKSDQEISGMLNKVLSLPVAGPILGEVLNIM